MRAIAKEKQNRWDSIKIVKKSFYNNNNNNNYKDAIWVLSPKVKRI